MQENDEQKIKTVYMPCNWHSSDYWLISGLPMDEIADNMVSMGLIRNLSSRK